MLLAIGVRGSTIRLLRHGLPVTACVNAVLYHLFTWDFAWAVIISENLDFKGGHMLISIASDHAGFEEKVLLVEHLRLSGHDVVDRGPEDDGRVDYPDYAVKVAYDVASGHAERGVLVCGTGIGMAIAANKVPGIRAANVMLPEFAALAREHNDANIVTISGRFVDDETNRAIVDAFLETDFAGGRHAARVNKIVELETPGNSDEGSCTLR